MSLLGHTLSKCGRNVTIEDRDMSIINGHALEVFSNSISALATIKTVSGVTLFDSTNVETIITHELRMAYDASVTAEKWVDLKGQRIRIVAVENCCEADVVMILFCTERGTEVKIVNSA